MSSLCDVLIDVQGKLAQIWTKSTPESVDDVPEYGALQAILDKQTVTLPTVLNTEGKIHKLKLEWMSDCSDVDEDCSEQCNLTGRDLTPNCKTYELTCLAQRTFKIPLVNSASYHSYIDKLTKGIKQNHKQILEKLSEHVILELLSNSGVNQYSGAPGQVAGNVTYISPMSWNDNIWGYFALVRKKNKMGEEIYIDDSNLWNLIFNRTHEAANADGKGNYSKLPHNRFYSDVINMSLHAPRSTFMVDRNAVAMVSLSPADVIYPMKNPTGTNPYELQADKITYTENNMFDERIKMEVIIQRVCENGTYFDVVRHRSWGIFAINPSSCNNGQTGILRFENGTLP